ATAERAERSFQRLTDPVALNVQPQHVDIVTLAARTTIAALAQQRASPVTAATLAIINQVEVQTSFASGRLVKWVIGVVPPVPYPITFGGRRDMRPLAIAGILLVVVGAFIVFR